MGNVLASCAKPVFETWENLGMNIHTNASCPQPNAKAGIAPQLIHHTTHMLDAVVSTPAWHYLTEVENMLYPPSTPSTITIN